MSHRRRSRPRPIRLTTNAVVIRVEVVGICPDHTEARERDVGTVEVGGRAGDTHTGLGRVAVRSGIPLEGVV